MIFGFNTDVRVDSTVYHVQSEVREAEHSLQTQVFVAGRCIGKRGFSFADYADPTALTPEKKHELLREQHRWVLGCVRGGHIADVFDPGVASPLTLASPSEPQQTAPVPVQHSGEPPRNPAAQPVATPAGEGAPKRLDLRFVSSARPEPGIVSLRFHLAMGGENAVNASISARFEPSNSGNGLTAAQDSTVTATTDSGGTAELRLSLPTTLAGDLCLTVEARSNGDLENKSCIRRFRLRPAGL